MISIKPAPVYIPLSVAVIYASAKSSSWSWVSPIHYFSPNKPVILMTLWYCGSVKHKNPNQGSIAPPGSRNSFGVKDGCISCKHSSMHHLGVDGTIDAHRWAFGKQDLGGYLSVCDSFSQLFLLFFRLWWLKARWMQLHTQNQIIGVYYADDILARQQVEGFVSYFALYKGSRNSLKEKKSKGESSCGIKRLTISGFNLPYMLAYKTTGRIRRPPNFSG